ncbi:MAG: endonuclease/exonuclease/phosphatase family protein [Gammaproteobacteria bacterium]
MLCCNIRDYRAADGKNDWVHRKAFCADVIRAQVADIICFQEMGVEQFNYLASEFPEYDTHAMTDEPCGLHPVNCIFYRREQYKRISAGGYWLSERPHVAGTKSWDSACVRLANWIRIEDRKSAGQLRIINTHLDHISQAAREQQAALIAEDARAFAADYPQILTGDMNCDSHNKVITILKAAGWVDTYNAVHKTEDPGPTYHAFLGPEHCSSIGKMDWIFMRGNLTVTDAEIIRTSVSGAYPSDHYFVSATLAEGKPGGGEHPVAG